MKVRSRTLWLESDSESIFEQSAVTPKRTYCNSNTWEEVYANIPSNKISLAKKFKEQIEAEFAKFVHVSCAKTIVVYPIWDEPIVAQFLGMVEENTRKDSLRFPNFDDVSYISSFFQMVEQDQSQENIGLIFQISLKWFKDINL